MALPATRKRIMKACWTEKRILGDCLRDVEVHLRTGRTLLILTECSLGPGSDLMVMLAYQWLTNRCPRPRPLVNFNDLLYHKIFATTPYDRDRDRSHQFEISTRWWLKIVCLVARLRNDSSFICRPYVICMWFFVNPICVPRDLVI